MCEQIRKSTERVWLLRIELNCGQIN